MRKWEMLAATKVNVQKKVCCTCKVIVFFGSLDLLFFSLAVFVAVAAWLALHDFIFCFSKL